MAYDEELADRVRRVTGTRPGVTEQRMFGGVSSLVDGNLACGVVHSDLMVRLGPDAEGDALRQTHARPMDTTGRPLRGMTKPASRAGHG